MIFSCLMIFDIFSNVHMKCSSVPDGETMQNSPDCWESQHINEPFDKKESWEASCEREGFLCLRELLNTDNQHGLI